jgi:uncharacterized membrane protein YdbT with pleckstrin-like domain
VFLTIGAIVGYIESNLSGGERLLYVAKIHWMAYVPGAFLLIFGLFASLSGGYMLSGLLIVLGLYMLIRAAIYAFTTELGVTSRRVVAKVGFIRRSTIELNHDKVEAFSVEQGLVGRLLGYGTLIVCGTGGSKTPIRSIDDPLAFRQQAVSAADSFKVPPTKSQ